VAIPDCILKEYNSHLSLRFLNCSSLRSAIKKSEKLDKVEKLKYIFELNLRRKKAQIIDEVSLNWLVRNSCL
jgi:hypothetical protein